MRGPGVSSALPATPRVSGKGSWQWQRRQDCAEVGGCSASAATRQACPLWSPAGRGSLGKESVAPCCGRLSPCPSSSSSCLSPPSVCLSVHLASHSVRLPGAAVRPPPRRLSLSLGAVLSADCRRSRWGLKGQLAVAGCRFIGLPGQQNSAPRRGGGQDPHPFLPGFDRISRDRTRRWLLGGVGWGGRAGEAPKCPPPCFVWHFPLTISC